MRLLLLRWSVRDWFRKHLMLANNYTHLHPTRAHIRSRVYRTLQLLETNHDRSWLASKKYPQYFRPNLSQRSALSTATVGILGSWMSSEKCLSESLNDPELFLFPILAMSVCESRSEFGFWSLEDAWPRAPNCIQQFSPNQHAVCRTAEWWKR